MSENYKPVKGDRVRVVYEGEAANIDDDGFTVADEVPVFFNDPGLVSVEKIEPPVEVFKPGDVVRAKGSGDVRTLARGGYVNHTTKMWHDNTYDTFTSEFYERVTLS